MTVHGIPRHVPSAAFRPSWERTERGAHVEPERVLVLECWEGLAPVLPAGVVRATADRLQATAVP